MVEKIYYKGHKSILGPHECFVHIMVVWQLSQPSLWNSKNILCNSFNSASTTSHSILVITLSHLTLSSFNIEIRSSLAHHLGLHTLLGSSFKFFLVYFIVCIFGKFKVHFHTCLLLSFRWGNHLIHWIGWSWLHHLHFFLL